jgi:hypothetical protein
MNYAKFQYKIIYMTSCSFLAIKILGTQNLNEMKDNFNGKTSYQNIVMFILAHYAKKGPILMT